MLLINILLLTMVLCVGYFNSENSIYGKLYQSKAFDDTKIPNLNNQMNNINDDSIYIDNESILPKTVDESIGSILNVITTDGLIASNSGFSTPNQLSIYDNSKEVSNNEKIQDKTSAIDTSSNDVENSNAVIIQANDGDDNYLLKLVGKTGKVMANDVFAGDKNEILTQAENICDKNKIDLSLCNEKVNKALDALDFTEAIMGESKIRLNFDTVSMDIFSSPT